MGILSCLLMISIIGCGGKSFDYEKPDSMMEGPGVFSKDPAGYTLYDSKAGKAGEKSKAPSDAGDGTATSTAAGTTAAGIANDSDEYREFQETGKTGIRRIPEVERIATGCR